MWGEGEREKKKKACFASPVSRLRRGGEGESERERVSEKREGQETNKALMRQQGKSNDGGRRVCEKKATSSPGGGEEGGGAFAYNLGR